MPAPGASGNILTSNGTEWLSTPPGTNAQFTTWIPRIAAVDGSESGWVYAHQSGMAVKVGRQVNFSMSIWLSQRGTATNALCIKGFPFLPFALGGFYQANPISYYTALSFNCTQLGLWFYSGIDYMFLKGTSIDAGQSLGSMDFNSFTNTTVLITNGSYFTE